MKRFVVFFVVLWASYGLHGQHKQEVKSEVKNKRNAAEVVSGEKLDQIDQASANQINLDSTLYFPGGIKRLQKTEDKYRLKDHQLAAKLDSLWMKELYTNGLFDTLYEDITTLDYKDISYPELSTDTLKARLKRLSQRTPFNVEYSPSLENVIKAFLKNRRGQMQRLMGISKFYFPLFEEALDKHDIPLEIKYLAIVESALNPKAKSRVGATGLWQFMYETGKMYGLNVNSYVDERSDPIKSTEAACKYLAKLYEIFGDWDLALAAYNSGPGNVSKAIRRSGGYQNYWNLRPFLPRETAGYVPAFLATMYIFEYADEHGFKNSGPETAYFETDTIRVKNQLSFDQISEMLNIEVAQLQFFNPAYKLDIVPFVENENYVLRLPKSEVGKFVANEASIYAHVQEEFGKREKPLPQLFETSESKITHRVRQGEYLGRIASKYNVRVTDLKKWNGLRSNNIKVGQRLVIYTKTRSAVKPENATVTNTEVVKAVQNSEIKEYTVKKGDTLWSIAQKFPGISVKNIQDWNDISGKNIKPGMKLKLCSC